MPPIAPGRPREDEDTSSPDASATRHSASKASSRSSTSTRIFLGILTAIVVVAIIVSLVGLALTVPSGYEHVNLPDTAIAFGSVGMAGVVGAMALACVAAIRATT